MAPVIPRETTRNRKIMSFFGGAIKFEPLAPSKGRCCKALCTFTIKDLPPVPEAAKPLMFHFHPYQEEYFEVLSGSATVTVEGREYVLKPTGREFTVPRMSIHGIQPTADSAEDLVLLGSSEDSGGEYQLDITFFENWWQYQTEILKYDLQPDIMQILAIWDGGDCVLPLPPWIPFSKLLARAVGIIIGRWLGGLLGYQPFYREWTTDWAGACKKMESSFFQKRFARV